jgi:branched-chain amino acid transport system permease protein
MQGAVDILGRAIPAYDLFLLAVGPVVLLVFWWILERTRFGILTRAATENRVLASALGVDERRLFTAVFAMGAFLAGLAGALQLPREPVNLGMDLSIIAEAFVVTVVGGLGSIPGAFSQRSDRTHQGTVHRAGNGRVRNRIHVQSSRSLRVVVMASCSSRSRMVC